MRFLQLTISFIVVSFSMSTLNAEVELLVSEAACDGYTAIDSQPTNNSAIQNATPAITLSGQSFVPTEASIGGISLSYAFSNSAETLTLELRSGTIPDNGPFTVLGTAACDIPASGTEITLNFEFASPIPVVIGNPYYFVVTDPPSKRSILISTDANSYPSGRYIRGNATSISAFPVSYDLKFATYKCTLPPPPVAPIPTMSQWMLFIFGLIMTSLAVIYIQKQHWAV